MSQLSEKIWRLASHTCFGNLGFMVLGVCYDKMMQAYNFIATRLLQCPTALQHAAAHN